MAKKKSRPSYTSRGTGKSVSNARAAGGRSLTSPIDRMLDKREAWAKGQNPNLVMANPNPNETNRPFIKLKANAVWGDPRKVRGYENR
jgi:hypothetical protein